jgi:hypothetical protein
MDDPIFPNKKPPKGFKNPLEARDSTPSRNPYA